MTKPKLLVNKPYVEIGGVKWATMNIGANSETDYGLYFQWGDTAGYTSSQVGASTTANKKPFTWADCALHNGTTVSTVASFTKYNGTNGDALWTLEQCDDAAAANWGGDWRMPTREEFAALGNNTIFINSGGTEITGSNKRTTLSGVTGIYLQDKTDSSKKLFFPAAGCCSNGSVYYAGSNGHYWSSSLYSSNVRSAYDFLYFYSSSVGWQGYGYRCIGRSVRAVLGI